MAEEPAKTLRALSDREELAMTWFRYAAGESGPDLHIHERHTDAFYVLTGELSVSLGPDGSHKVLVRPGTFVAAPAGLAHTFANESAEEVTFLNIHAPNMGFTEMMRARRDGHDEDAERFDQGFGPGPIPTSSRSTRSTCSRETSTSPSATRSSELGPAPSSLLRLARSTDSGALRPAVPTSSTSTRPPAVS